MILRLDLIWEMGKVKKGQYTWLSSLSVSRSLILLFLPICPLLSPVIGSSVKLRNCVFTGNIAVNGGGGFNRNNGGTLDMDHTNHFYDNIPDQTCSMGSYISTFIGGDASCEPCESGSFANMTGIGGCYQCGLGK